MVQITCKNLSLGYEGKTVTQNINFSVNCGDYLCIVGENGSGKSTLIKAILRLIKPLAQKFKNRVSSSTDRNSKGLSRVCQRGRSVGLFGIKTQSVL